MNGLLHISQVFDFILDDPLIRFNFKLSIFFVFVTAFFFFLIIFSRIAAGYAYVRRKSIEKKIQLFLSEYIFEEVEDDQVIEEFYKKYITNTVRREIVLENLLALHKSLIGDSADKLRKLYVELRLNKYSKQKLYSGNWNEIAKGIVELAEMDIKGYASLINSFVNHPHPVLRSEAQVATLKLKTDGLFSFLDDLKNPLLDWQQQQLAKAASKAPLAVIPDFKKWLFHKQETVTIFSLRMISHYWQHNALPDLLMLLDHPSELIREQTIITLRHLESSDAVSKLTDMYKNESIDLKLQILKTLPVMDNNESISFYEQELFSSDKRLQLAAARALYKGSKEAKRRVDSIKHDQEHPLNALVQYASI